MAEATNGDVRIHYEVEGAGPPLILHTGGGGDLRMWRLAGYDAELQDHRLVLMDHRGHGQSGRPTGLEDHRIERYVEDVIAVADAERIDRFAFFGYSGGAGVGYALASRHPDRVDALIGLGAVGATDESREEDVEAARAVATRGIEWLIEGLRADEGALTPWFEEQMRSTDPQMLALQLESWASWGGPWSELAHIQAPTLIVVGELEEGADGVAAEHADGAVSLLAHGSAAVVPGVGHCEVFVRSDLVLPHVRAFLENPPG